MISFSPQERAIQAVTTRLELATSALTGQRSDLLSYATMGYSLARGDSNSYDLLNGKASCRLNDMPSRVTSMIAKSLTPRKGTKSFAIMKLTVAPQGVEPCSAE
jgi:hypothetical protein